MLPITTSASDEFFSRINIDDFERPRTFKIRAYFIDFCDLRLQRTLVRMNCGEMAGGRLTVCEQELL